MFCEKFTNSFYLTKNVVFIFLFDYNNIMKTILITGSSGGIGNEIAKKFANNNNNIILICNKNLPIAAKLKQSFGNCNMEIYKCDLTQTDQIYTMVNKIIDSYKKIDCLINCAGISKFQLIQDTTEEDYFEVFDTNLKSIIMLTAAVSKHMISEKYGKIVNISSMWGNVGSSMESLYSASKGAINTLTLSLAKELGPSNINVNAICPGLIKTRMNSSLSKETINSIVENTPLGRIGTASDVAELAAFLCDDKSSFITGQIITVDGGFTL